MEKEWIHGVRGSEQYVAGVEEFLNFAFANAEGRGEILCPCKKCNNCKMLNRVNVYEHLIVLGFNPSYTQWVLHGERNGEPHDVGTHERTIDDDIEALFRDTFPHIRDLEHDGVEDFVLSEEEYANPKDKDTEKIQALFEEGQKPLYNGCESMTMISFVIRLFTLKCINGWSNESYSQLMKLLIKAFPKDAKIPQSYEETRGMVKVLGLEYRKIDACEKDCMLFWKDHVNADFCLKCGLCRWVTNDVEASESRNGKRKLNESVEAAAKKLPNGRKVPKKTLRHFPLVPRLKRLYMCSKTAKEMIWHEESSRDDRTVRHPRDALAWNNFYSTHPEFAIEPRNVLLGLSSDGFNPYRTMSIKYSMWPVTLVVYNLPPWMCMKPAYTMLSLLIPGPKSPGNDIDIFMQPLIDELKVLWVDGVETLDASRKESFVMHAALLWTINDYPAYAMLSGYSTKGKMGCPYCQYETDSQYLTHSKKVVYMGHRKFLCANHRWRANRRAFNGKRELRSAPKPLSGSEIFDHLRDFENDFGKPLHGPARNGPYPFKKRSIFFDLPYWKHNLLRHNLDIMHIEKNIVDSIVGTLLDLPDKTKDHLNARKDLKELGIREELHPIDNGNNKYLLPAACFSMGKKEKDIFCKVLKGAKFPSGYASNISGCVNVNQHTLSGLKTHDCHFLLHYLLPLAVRKTLPKHVAGAIIRLSSFFRGICSKVLKFEELDRLEEEIKEIICQFEMIFPPAFFDIMLHLPIHLVNEARLGGPITYRWMYSPERYLLDLKNLVRNRSRPEGSIAEGYIAKESSTFCSRYLGDDATTRFNRPFNRHHVPVGERTNGTSIFPYIGCPIGGTKCFRIDRSTWDRAQRYVLYNTPEIAMYTREHDNLRRTQQSLRSGHSRGSTSDTSLEFHEWFAIKIREENVSEDLRWLSRGPKWTGKRYKGFAVNGFRFRTESFDLNKRTQNAGVTIVAATVNASNSSVEDVTYYGVVQDIIELDYHGQFSIVLFQCKWFRSSKDLFELPIVDYERLIYKDDPFVFASQVKQVFYVQDPTCPNLYNVLRAIPRDTYDMEDVQDEGGVETYWMGEPNPIIDGVGENVDISSWGRNDVQARTVDINSTTIVGS